MENNRDELVSKIQALEKRASAIRSKLAALDETIRLHEVVIEPTDIRPVKPHSNTYLVPFGQLGRSILDQSHRERCKSTNTCRGTDFARL